MVCPCACPRRTDNVELCAALHVCVMDDYICIRAYLPTTTLDRRPQCHSIVNFSLCPAEPYRHLGAVEIPCQMSPCSPRTRIKRMYALARVSAAQCADRDLCYSRGVLTDFHAVLNLLVDTQCVRPRTFMRTWRHILYFTPAGA
jgi:hypothetical protein